MLRRLALAAALCLGLAGGAAAQTLGFTFDDGVDPDQDPAARQINDDLLRALRDAGVRAMLFPALARTGSGAGSDLVAQWSMQGHAIGNHTSRHRSLGSARLTLGEFIVDVVEDDIAFRHLPTFTRMLRFPFLKEGETAAKRDGMRAWMARNGYRPAPVSIDTSDWYFDAVLRRLLAAGQQEGADRLRRAYVDHLLDRATFYDTLARTVLGRSPAHVLLLHVNAINAQCLPAVIDAFKRKGWTIEAATLVFDDPLYRMAPATLPAGESIVWSLAKARGVAGLRYPAEDAQYEAPTLRALGLLP